MTNADVLQTVNETRSILDTICTENTAGLDVLTHDGFLKDIMEGKMMGKPTTERNTLNTLSDSAVQLKKEIRGTPNLQSKTGKDGRN